MSQETNLTFIEHLEEFRVHIIKSLIVLAAAACGGFAFAGKVLPFIARPVGTLVFIAPQEAFVANIKIALYLGIFLASPFIAFQIWKFISSGLYEGEKKYIKIFAVVSFMLFITGAVFGYLIVIPVSLKFLLGFASDFMRPYISVSKYISFVGTLTLMFGLVFELPLASLFLTKTGIVTPGLLMSKRRHAVVAVFIAAAILTPPDVVTQCLMAIPLLALYETGIFVSKLAYKGHEKKDIDEFRG